MGGNDYKVSGNLTIRGVTRPVVLDVRHLGVWQTPFWVGNEDKGPITRAGFVAEARINRRDFGVSWNGALTTASTLQCPHGGTVTIVSANGRATAGGVPLALATDSFIVAGCAFTIPPGVPSPCVKVQWIVSDLRNGVAGAPTLSQSSVGLCLAATQAPQGPVVIVSTQAVTRPRSAS